MDILSSRLILRPADYPTTLAFYRDTLGLAIAREYPGGTVLFAGQSLIELASHGASGTSTAFEGGVWLQVRDAAAAEGELRAKGAPIDREARQEPWGLIELWTRDPDGVTIVLVQVPEDHPLRRDTRSELQ